MENEEELLNFNQPTFKFVPKEIHSWKQQGPYLVCKSCDLVHSAFIGMEKIMVGVDEKGQPLLKKRQII